MNVPASDRPRLLAVCHRVPYPPDKGDRIRNWHVLRQLASFADVSLACLADEPVSDATRAALANVASRVAIVPLNGLVQKLRMAGNALVGRSLSEGAFWKPDLATQIADWHREAPFDAAIASASSVAGYLRHGDLKSVPGFVDVVDCDSRKWFDFAEAVRPPTKWLFRFEGTRIRKLECEIAGWAAACTLVSDAESKLFDDHCGPGSALTATNGVDLDFFQPRTTATAKTVTFVGAMDYLPNVDAVTWFANEVWPHIRERHPDAEFRIVGRKPNDAVQRLGQITGVTVVGTVPDVRNDVAASACVVVPMRLSRGLQNKVLESLAMAKATVVAPPALAALKTVPGRDLLKAESADDWVTAVCQLLADEALRNELGQSGRRFVEANHDWSICLKPLTERIREAADRMVAA
jgi:sugar transferase (PEP-CTERM/EpsH1 system associated)